MIELNTISWLVLTALAAGLGVQSWLALRHMSHINRHRNAVPHAFAGKIPLQAHQKAADYSIAKTRLGLIGTFISAVLLLLWTFAGGLEWLDHFWRGMGWQALYTGTAFILSFMLISTLLDIPLSLYSTFIIEERFGFNKMTGKLFLLDMLKGMLLALLLGTPLILAVLWLMEKSVS